MTDIPRLRAGHVGGQFWSVWIPTTMSGPLAVETTVQQIDIVKGLAARYPADLAMAYSADDIVRAHKAGKVASLIGVEGVTRSTILWLCCASFMSWARAT